MALRVVLPFERRPHQGTAVATLAGELDLSANARLHQALAPGDPTGLPQGHARPTVGRASRPPAASTGPAGTELAAVFCLHDTLPPAPRVREVAATQEAEDEPPRNSPASAVLEPPGVASSEWWPKPTTQAREAGLVEDPIQHSAPVAPLVASINVEQIAELIAADMQRAWRGDEKPDLQLVRGGHGPGSTGRQRKAIATDKVVRDGGAMVDGAANHPMRPVPFIRVEVEK